MCVCDVDEVGEVDVDDACVLVMEMKLIEVDVDYACNVSVM